MLWKRKLHSRRSFIVYYYSEEGTAPDLLREKAALDESQGPLSVRRWMKEQLNILAELIGVIGQLLTHS